MPNTFSILTLPLRKKQKPAAKEGAQARASGSACSSCRLVFAIELFSKGNNASFILLADVLGLIFSFLTESRPHFRYLSIGLHLFQNYCRGIPCSICFFFFLLFCVLPDCRQLGAQIDQPVWKRYGTSTLVAIHHYGLSGARLTFGRCCVCTITHTHSLSPSFPSCSWSSVRLPPHLHSFAIINLRTRIEYIFAKFRPDCVQKS